MSAAPKLSMSITEKSQAGVIAFHKQALQLTTSKWNLREQMRQIDLQYIREKDFTVEHRRAQLANKLGDPNKFQNVTVPVVLPAVETGVAYQSAVFLDSSPLFPVISDPAHEDQALQLESVLDSQAIRGGWVRELTMAFRDGQKYNLGGVVLEWETCKIPNFESQIDGSTKPALDLEWQGNTLQRLDPYNTFWDTRVAVTDVYKDGEFAGYTKLYSRIKLKEFINFLDKCIKNNIKAAFESATSLNSSGSMSSDLSGTYYTPAINPDAMIELGTLGHGTNWLEWAGLTGGRDKTNIQYKNAYEVSFLYARILPSDFRIIVPYENHPQVWKFIIVNHSVVIYAERCTDAHQHLPLYFLSPNEDGLRYQTKSPAQNVVPIQSVTTALLNSVVHSRRRAISDRTLYDPSRVSEAAINSDNPSAKIPVRPAAYGKPLNEAVFPFPYRDDNSVEMLNQIPVFMQFSDRILGQNAPRQGQFVKGNKTDAQFEASMQGGTDRDACSARMAECQFMTPLKEDMKLNVLQYQQAGYAFSREKQKLVKINPVELRKASLFFKVTDGQQPSSKVMKDDQWGMAVQSVASSPQLAKGYNVPPMFSYLMKIKGANLAPFEKSPQQQAYENAVESWQQVGTASANKGIPFNTPMPQPQQFGYVPQTAQQANDMQTAANQGASQA